MASIKNVLFFKPARPHTGYFSFHDVSVMHTQILNSNKCTENIIVCVLRHLMQTEPAFTIVRDL